MSEIRDLTGKTFHYLTVVERAPNNKYKRAQWLCRCKCGNTLVVTGNALLRRNTKSCGCYTLELTQRMGKNNAKLTSGYEYLFEIYQANAKKRGLDFSLDSGMFREITSSLCHYCGIAPYRFRKSRSGHAPYKYNGIDRVDNNLGYVKGNCVPACLTCNYAKKAMSYDEFMNWLSRVARFNAERFSLCPTDWCN